MTGCYGSDLEDRIKENQLLDHLEEAEGFTCEVCGDESESSWTSCDCCGLDICSDCVGAQDVCTECYED